MFRVQVSRGTRVMKIIDLARDSQLGWPLGRTPCKIFLDMILLNRIRENIKYPKGLPSQYCLANSKHATALRPSRARNPARVDPAPTFHTSDTDGIGV